MSTNDCDDGGLAQIPIDAGLGVDPDGEEITTELVGADPSDRNPQYSLRADCDTHSALIIGLAQYLRTLSIDRYGRRIRLVRSTAEHADSIDETMEFPVATVMSDADGTYESPPDQVGFLSQSTPQARREPTAGRAGKPGTETVRFTEPGVDGYANLVYVATYMVGLAIEILCDTKIERRAVAKMIEDGMRPYVTHGDVFLRLHHYHGVIGRYTLSAQNRADQDDAVAGGRFGLIFRVASQCPSIRVHRTIRAALEPQVSVNGTSALSPT